jgi:hydrogenase-4 component B
MHALFILMVVAYALGMLGALASGNRVRGRWLAALGAVVGAAAGAALGAMGLIVENSLTLVAGDLLPLVNGLALRLDALGAFFLLVIGVGAIPATIYGVGYSAVYTGRYSLRLLGAMLNLLLLSLSLQVLADNALTFLLAWEAMSLSAYWLVLTEHDQPGTVGAGRWYIAMTHAGFVALVAMFLLLAASDLTASFSTIRANAAALTTLQRDAIFLLALVGFGAKAGIVPLHVWLPMAHPVAPSHVSALMSGVVIKMGVYGLLRVGLDLLGSGPTWWGGVVLVVGAASALLGILYALMEHDLKRLLAYSSVENIGIIFLGIGAGLLFTAYNLPTAAMLAYVAALYHTLNHTAFKGLLFMGAGSVLHATHTRNMNLMGGLIKRMPQTALFFLIGAVAIAGLPPLNGFVSEWLLFQALLPGVSIAQPLIAVLVTLAVGVLALTGGLVAAGFVKAFGITFLAIPRSSAAEDAHESIRSMQIGMGLLAVICVVLGLTPTLVVPLVGRAVAGMDGLPAVIPPFTLNLTLQTPPDFASISPTLIALGLLVLLALTPFVMSLLRVNRQLRLGDTWGCGRVGQTPRMEYTATAFAEPLRRVFAELYRPTKELTIDFHPESKYFVQSIEFRSEIRPWFEGYLYAPLLGATRWLSRHVRLLQSGSLHSYLVYVFITLLLMLSLTLLPG